MGSSIYSILPLILLKLTILLHSTNARNHNIQDYVIAHNAIRAEVGVGPVSWNKTVAKYAQNYANKRIGDCKLIHSQGPYGENLFQGWSTENTEVDVVKYWASEKKYYHYDSNSCDPNEACGHYTQIVWAKSVNIGCARVTCKTGPELITCNYYPPGNYIGERPY